jgi:anti-sigma factor RsiW
MTGDRHHDRPPGEEVMTDRWTDRLSEYLDETLPLGDRRELEAHLATCAACAAALDDLRRLVALARALPAEDAARLPEDDPWPAIEARLRAEPVRAVPVPRGDRWTAARFRVSMGQLAAACVAIVAISASAVWFARDWGRREFASQEAARARAVVVVPATSAPAEAAQNEIASLKRVLDARRDQLDPNTLRAIEESLAAIEAAVEQARLALEADPGDPYLVAHLEELTDRHLDLLRRAVDLAGGAE